jgi:hydroxymethylbilane synthase
MSQINHIVIGTRGSELALIQTNIVAKQLQVLHPNLSIETTVINTTGDYVLDVPLSKLGDRGIFTKELDAALLENKIDLAVHSLKDVATILPDGITLGAVCKREDAREVFIAHPNEEYKSLADVPVGGTIATGSLRRTSMLLAHRADLKIAEIRGNLNTRRKKLEESGWDGMMLAYAGIIRMGWTSIVTEVIDQKIVIPSPGQGALAVAIRNNDSFISELVRPLNHLPTSQATIAERAVLREFEGGCQVPVGAYAIIENNVMTIVAMVGSLDGRKIVRKSLSGSPSIAERLGFDLAHEIFARGGKEILEEIRKTQR